MLLTFEYINGDFCATKESLEALNAYFWEEALRSGGFASGETITVTQPAAPTPDPEAPTRPPS